MLGYLVCQGNSGQDVDAKLFVPLEGVVRNGQRLPVGRRAERARKQQAAPFTVFNRIAQDRGITGHRVRFGKETDKGQTVGKAAAHGIVGNEEMVALAGPGFGKNMMTLARPRSAGQGRLEAFQSVVGEFTVCYDRYAHPA